MVTRRKFLAGVAAAPLVIAGCATAPVKTVEPVQIIDTHTHFYDPHRLGGIPWPPKTDEVLYRPVLPPEFVSLTRPLGVMGTIVVEASPRVEDNDWLLKLAAENAVILGVVGHLKPGETGFVNHLNRLAVNPKFRGIRSGLWGVSLASRQQGYLSDLKRLAEKNLSLDVLCNPAQMAAVDEIAKKVPQLKIIINHLGGAKIDGNWPSPEWINALERVAQNANVHMKVSGLVEATGKEKNAPDALAIYRPTLDVIWNTFGPDRVIFGSNWPVSNRCAPYNQVLSIVTAYFEERGRAAMVKYFYTNARKFYGV